MKRELRMKMCRGNSLDDGNNQGLYLPSSPAYEISMPPVTPIVPILVIHPIFIPMRSNIWNTIVQASNLHKLAMAATIFNKPKVCKAVKYAISDSQATDDFLAKGSPVVNEQPATHLVKVTFPNGKVIQPSHTFALMFPGFKTK